MDILIASNNAGKIREFKGMLGPYFDEFYSMKDKQITLEVEEDGDTFEANAIKKAVEAYRVSGLCTLADDSGLEVDALDGAPGVYSARYAGEKATDEENNRLLLKNMQDIPHGQRGARFVSVLALCLGENRIVTARGAVEGEILTEGIGENGFGYDPLFLSTETGKTFGEMSMEAKSEISHRSRALQVLIEKLKSENLL